MTMIRRGKGRVGEVGRREEGHLRGRNWKRGRSLLAFWEIRVRVIEDQLGLDSKEGR